MLPRSKVREHNARDVGVESDGVDEYHPDSFSAQMVSPNDNPIPCVLSEENGRTGMGSRNPEVGSPFGAIVRMGGMRAA